MNLTRCSNGHFYDADKFDSCPHCSKGAQSAGAAVAENSVTVGRGQETVGRMPQETVGRMPQETVGRMPENIAPGAPVAPTPAENKDLKLAVDDVQKTVGMFNVKKGKEPVVGWLVCVDGPHKGEDFRLRMGKNFIGRAQSMDVVLSGDNSVSREKHSIIVYEPKGNLFVIQSGESKELSYLNESLVLSPQVLNPYDTITLGNSSLVFVPFCTESVTWEKYADKTEE